MSKILITILFVLFGNSLFSITRTATGSSWDNINHWNPSGPVTSGDTLIIPNGITMTMSTNQTKSYAYLRVIVDNGGTWVFPFKAKLELSDPSSSIILTDASSNLIALNGNSIIEIDNTGILGNSAGSGYSGPDAANGDGWVSNSANPPSSNPLPVNLISFYGENLEGEIVLNWQTESEINNDYFSIERWNNHSDWSEIGQVSGNGTTNEAQYYSFEYLREQKKTEEYFRLVQVDFDGQSKVYPAILVSSTGEIEETYTLKTSENYFIIKSNEGLGSSTEVYVYDQLGKSMQPDITYANKENIILNRASLPKGILIIRLVQGGASQHLKICN